MTFTADQFTATKFHSAQDKADFANQFVKFVDGGFKPEDFLQELYDRLCQTFGHIAQYDGSGFWQHFFSSLDSKVQFIKQCVEYTPVGSSKWTFCDVERELQSWMAAEKILNRCELWSGLEYDQHERAEYERLKSKFGDKQLLPDDNESIRYEDLACLIDGSPAEQREADVTVYLRKTDEWLPVRRVAVTTENDVLDKNHIFLEIDA